MLLSAIYEFLPVINLPMPVVYYNALSIVWEDKSKERMVFWHVVPVGVFWGKRLVKNMSRPDWEEQYGWNNLFNFPRAGEKTDIWKFI